MRSKLYKQFYSLLKGECDWKQLVSDTIPKRLFYSIKAQTIFNYSAVVKQESQWSFKSFTIN